MLTKILMRDILSHAAEEYPNEICGVVAEGRYYQCRNVSTSPDKEAQLHPADALEFKGRIQAFVHSHPDATSRMSESDRVQMEFFNIPYIIVGYPSSDFGFYVPTGYKAPLLGRSFYHGVLDCYALIKDFYERELGISLLDFDREDKWWENADHESLYVNNFEKTGFSVVNNLQYGDVIICTVGDTKHPNHALIFLGENGSLKSEVTTETVGTKIILHHLYGRKSAREVYGDIWESKTNLIVRHKELL